MFVVRPSAYIGEVSLMSIKTGTSKKAAAAATKNRRRIVWAFLIVAVLLIALAAVLGKIMIIKSEEYTEKAISQQTKDQTIDPKRGSILDRNGNELATTTVCYTLYARPAKFKEMKMEEVRNIETALSEIIDVPIAEIDEKIHREKTIVNIAKYLDSEQAKAIRNLDVKGFEVAEGTKRSYPQGNFASQLLGSVTDDNTGRSGLEYFYDEYLSGEPGRWVTNTDNTGNELVEGTERYFAPEDGLNLVLTIDEAIQYYVEKAIKTGLETTGAERIECLVMNPNTGEVLANAVTGGFDPNDPYTPQNLTEKEQEEYDALEENEKVAYWSRMWRNPIVSDTYEPGSTFKLITAASAIEEKTVSLDQSFNCAGSVTVADTRIFCSGRIAHGTQTLKKAVGNSCNTVMATIARKIGKEKYVSYIKHFGIGSKTGIDYPGEAAGLLNSYIGPVEVATMGYGHGISVTPIELLSAVNSIVNGGNLIKPRYVMKMTDSEGNAVKEFEPEIVRQVISKKTSQEMRSIMEYVVSDGGGGAAKVAGYKVGGKTGTAYKVVNGAYTEDFYSSFVGVAPMDDPQISVLVVVDSPKGSYYGSVVAAPIAKEIISETLRYLGVTPSYTADEQERIETGKTTVPDVVGESFEDAAGIINGKGLKYSRPDSTKDNDEWTVVAQYPVAGSKAKEGDVVYIYRE